MGMFVQMIAIELKCSPYNIFNYIAAFYNAQELIRVNVPKRLLDTRVPLDFNFINDLCSPDAYRSPQG